MVGTWIGPLLLSLFLKIPPRNLKPWFILSFSAEVALYLYKFTIWPCIGCCCHICTFTLNCYLDMLDKLQKCVCGTVRLSLVASLKPCLIVKLWPTQVFFIDISLVDTNLNWLNWFLLLILVAVPHAILIGCF